MDKRIIVALDAMGGDYAPVETVKGAVDAVKELNVDIKLVGPEDVVKADLNSLQYHLACGTILETMAILRICAKCVLRPLTTV